MKANIRDFLLVINR